MMKRGKKSRVSQSFSIFSALVLSKYLLRAVNYSQFTGEINDDYFFQICGILHP